MENPERQALVARVAHELETDGLFFAELADALAVVLQKSIAAARRPDLRLAGAPSAARSDRCDTGASKM